MLIVRGATLAGMAAAARLARLGHAVTLVTNEQPLGTRWAGVPGPGCHVVDAMAPVIMLPALWRDLFKKSGGHLQAELNRAGLAWAEAPPIEHHLSDGSTLALPTERGAQYRVISEHYGQDEAARWRDLLDDLDGVWAAFRTHALEGTQQVDTRQERAALWLDRSLGDVAARLTTPLAEVVTHLGVAPGAPALLALPLTIERTFGRWQLVDDAGLPQRASVLIDLLAQRLSERGVRIVDQHDGAVDVDCLPPPPQRRWWARRPRPSAAATPRHELLPATEVVQAASGQGLAGVREVVDHRQLRRTWLRPVADGVLATTVNLTTSFLDTDDAPPTAAARDWLARPPTVDAASLRASKRSPAGGQPWGELASAALAVYELHEQLTGEDARPTNRDFRLPRVGG